MFTAPGHVRLCIGKHALCSECSSPDQERLALASRGNERRCMGVSPSHGGLTPAAPGHVRLCVAMHALCSECASPDQERLA